MQRKNLLLLATLIIFTVVLVSGCSPFNQSPVASFTADPTSGSAPLTVDFDASGSTDSNGNVASYDWDFGDGDEGQGEQVSHTYDSEGEYTAELTVTDDGGATDTKDVDISVGPGNKQPTASFTATATSGSAPFHVNFNSDSTDPDGTIVSYEWSLGDGTTASGDTTTHTYNNSGDYNVRLKVTDDKGATSSAAKTLSLPPGSNKSPSARFTADPESGRAPLEVSFDASGSSDPDGQIESYDWNFDDGESTTGEVVTHTFDSGGDYEVTLTVTDDGGASSNIKHVIEVDPAAPPTPGSG